MPLLRTHALEYAIRRVQILYYLYFLFYFCLLEGVRSRSSTPVNTPLVSLLGDVTSPTNVAHYVSMTSDLRVLRTEKH